MGGGAGGVLNKMIPGYKDIIWNKLPLELRKSLISRQHAKFESNLYKDCVSSTSSVQRFDSAVAARLAPDYSARTPVVDYARQFSRGTLVEGRDSYLPTAADQNRLVNIEEPYSESEQAEREQHLRYDLQFALALMFGGFLLYDYKNSRPVAWCMIFDPAKPRQPWYFKAAFRSYDVKSVRRGFEVFRAVCSSCHSLKKCKWWYLMKDVYPVRRVQEFAAEKTMVDGLTDEGELNIRPCMTWDYFPRPFPTEEAAKEANNGKEPPDFSEGPYFFRGGADYFFAILTGFRDPPVGLKLTEGTYYNPWFGGAVIGMSPPLEDGLVDFEDGTPATVSQMAKDVVNFLVFVSDPCHNERKLMVLKATSGMIVAVPAFFIMRRFAIGGAWNRRIDFDKLRNV